MAGVACGTSRSVSQALNNPPLFSRFLIVRSSLSRPPLSSSTSPTPSLRSHFLPRRVMPEQVEVQFGVLVTQRNIEKLTADGHVLAAQRILTDATVAEQEREPPGSRLHLGFIDEIPPGTKKFNRAGCPNPTKRHPIWPPLKLPKGTKMTNAALSQLKLRSISCYKCRQFEIDFGKFWLKVFLCLLRNASADSLPCVQLHGRTHTMIQIYRRDQFYDHIYTVHKDVSSAHVSEYSMFLLIYAPQKRFKIPFCIDLGEYLLVFTSQDAMCEVRFSLTIRAITNDRVRLLGLPKRIH